MKKTYLIKEYGSFTREKMVDGYVSLPKSTFDALENFVLSNSSKNTDALELMSLSAKKGVGKIITAKNYVGVISMDDGTTIEILPKIYSRKESTEEKTKKVLVDMLKTLRSFPHKSLQSTSVNIDKINIFELFIKMFVDEIFYIVKYGLKESYETVQSNEIVFKGKIKFAEHFRYNYAHKERSFVEYDEFNLNRAENRLLKTTLIYLYKVSSSFKNKRDIKTLLSSFVEVDESLDYDSDFAKIKIDRNTKDYTNALMWSKFFLRGKSFTSYSGSNIAFALLFPMEMLFESYIAMQLRKMLRGSKYSLLIQDKSYHLVDLPTKKFLMKPDLVIKNKECNCIYILDTKWKILSNTKSNYGISQTDMYQMYAYQKKYNASKVTLIYPYTKNISLDKDIEYTSLDGFVVRIKFVDLFDIRNSLRSLIIDFEN